MKEKRSKTKKIFEEKLSVNDKNLKGESTDRKKLMNELNDSLENYAYKILEYEKRIKEYELMEIKYKNLEREMKEKTNIYQIKISDLEKENDKLEKEIFDVKKEILNNESKKTALKSIIDLVINDYGIDYIVETSGISSDKIKEYLQD